MGLNYYKVYVGVNSKRGLIAPSKVEYNKKEKRAVNTEYMVENDHSKSKKVEDMMSTQNIMGTTGTVNNEDNNIVIKSSNQTNKNKSVKSLEIRLK